MGDILEKYTQLKKKVEQAQQNADKAEGALGQVMQRLEKEFECSSLKQAQKKLEQLQEEEVIAKEEFEEAVEAFEDEWGDKI